jgi:hypothetical protein
MHTGLRSGAGIAVDVPVHFVVFDWNRWESLLSRKDSCVAACASSIVTNEDVWVVQTYLQLTARGVRASVGPEPVAAAINIVDGINLGPAASAADVFYVGCRGDGHYPAICQVVLHQNTLPPVEAPALYIPQWPQPALIPRAQSRGGIRCLGFFGHAKINLAADFRDAAFGHELRRRGCRLEIRGRSAGHVSWNDYSQIDLVLSVRSIPHAHRLLKPVNKLSNAWLARVPALIGPEPAVEAIRESPLDYVPIHSPADALDALDMLQADSALYQRMIEHGSRRGESFSDDAVAARWLSLLETLCSRYESWRLLDARARMTDLARRRELHRMHFALHATSIHAEYSNLGFGQKWWESLDTASASA